MYDTMYVLYDGNVRDVRSYVRRNGRHYVWRNVPFYVRRYVRAVPSYVRAMNDTMYDAMYHSMCNTMYVLHDR